MNFSPLSSKGLDVRCLFIAIAFAVSGGVPGFRTDARAQSATQSGTPSNPIGVFALSAEGLEKRALETIRAWPEGGSQSTAHRLVYLASFSTTPSPSETESPSGTLSMQDLLGPTGEPRLPVDQALVHKHPHLRKSALIASWELGRKDMDTLVTEVLSREREPLVLESALGIAAELGKDEGLREEVAKALMKGLGHPDWRVRKSAIIAAYHCRTKSLTDNLLQLVRDRSSEVRVVACLALAHWKESSLDPVLPELFRDRSPEVRGAALRSLVTLESSRHLERVVELLEDESPYTWSPANRPAPELLSCFALRTIVCGLDLRCRQIRGEAVRTLGAMGTNSAIDALLPRLREEALQVDAINALCRLSDCPWNEDQIQSLIDLEPGSSFQALSVLAALPHPTAAAYVHERWDTIETSRWSSLLVRARDAKNRSLIPLAKRLLSHSSAPLRSTATHYLEAVEATSLAPSILARLQDAVPGCRASAARCLGSFGSREAVDDLLSLLEDPHPSVRSAAASSLGEIGDPGAENPVLTRLARGEGWEGWKLFRSPEGQERVAQLLDGPPDPAQLAALRILESIARNTDEGLKDSTLEKVFARLKSPNSKTVQAASETLAATCDLTLGPRLARHLLDEESTGDFWVAVALSEIVPDGKLWRRGCWEARSSFFEQAKSHAKASQALKPQVLIPSPFQANASCFR